MIVVDTAESSWGPWSECNPACGLGVRTREMLCGGLKCKGGPSREVDMCIRGICKGKYLVTYVQRVRRTKNFQKECSHVDALNEPHLPEMENS